jgi:hypothetical protein
VVSVPKQVRHVPGMETIAIVSGTPPLVSGSDRTGVTVPGRPAFDDRDDADDDKSIVPAYFTVLRVDPVLALRTQSSCVA